MQPKCLQPCLGLWEGEGTFGLRLEVDWTKRRKNRCVLSFFPTVDKRCVCVLEAAVGAVWTT